MDGKEQFLYGYTVYMYVYIENNKYYGEKIKTNQTKYIIGNYFLFHVVFD
tara:strand:+ start:4211 stop:4360 length:150 start_codon:yes stop_codon:yes gene_type:complete